MTITRFVVLPLLSFIFIETTETRKPARRQASKRFGRKFTRMVKKYPRKPD